MAEDKNKYILSINGMSKSFGRNKVLKHIDLNVKPGTIMGLMGENGAGKIDDDEMSLRNVSERRRGYNIRRQRGKFLWP